MAAADRPERTPTPVSSNQYDLIVPPLSPSERENYPGRSIEQQAIFVTEALERLGLPLHPGSRLSRGKALFDRRPEDRRTIYVHEPEFLDACEVLRDFQIYDIVLQRPNQFRSDPLAYERLRTSLEDHLTPHLGDKSTPGRDAQAELFMSAGMYRAGQDVFFQAPRKVDGVKWPDLRARIGGRYFYVEVKRSKSRARILPRVSDAIAQLELTGCPGAVAIDISFALNPSRRVEDRNLSDDEYRRIHEEEYRAELQPMASDLLRMLEGTRVGGVFFQEHIVRRFGETTHGLMSWGMAFDNQALRGPHRDAWRRFVDTLPHAWASDL